MNELFNDDDGGLLFDSDLEKLKKDEREERQLQLRRWQQDFKATFCSTSSGKRVLWWLIHECGVFQKHTQHNASAYSFLAKNEIGQDIVDIIGAADILRTLIDVKNEELRANRNKENQDD